MKLDDKMENILGGFVDRPGQPSYRCISEWAAFFKETGYDKLLEYNKRDWGIIGEMMVLANEVLGEHSNSN